MDYAKNLSYKNEKRCGDSKTANHFSYQGANHWYPTTDRYAGAHIQQGDDPNLSKKAQNS